MGVADDLVSLGTEVLPGRFGHIEAPSLQPLQGPVPADQFLLQANGRPETVISQSLVERRFLRR